MQKLGFLTSDLPTAKSARQGDVSRPNDCAAKSVVAREVVEDFSAEERLFLDGLAKHRMVFSAEAVVARAKAAEAVVARAKKQR